MGKHCSLRLVLSTVLVIVLLIAGCSKAVTNLTSSTTSTSAGKSTSAPATTPTGPYGELKVAYSTLNSESFYPPTAVPANNGMLVSPMVESLLQSDGSKLAPMIAEKWEVSPDGLSWTYYVRKGVKFQNGDDLTAADVKFSLDAFASGSAYNKELRDAVERTEIVDNYTVRVYSKGTRPFLPYLTGFMDMYLGMVLPKAYIEQIGVEKFQRGPIGSGPWKFSKWVPGDMVQYEAVTNHWRKTPAFKTLSLYKIPQASTRVAMLKTGQVDVTDVAVEDAVDLESKGFKTATLGMSQAMVLLYGNYDPRSAGMPTADLRVRQALSLAINRDEINKNFFLGKGSSVTPPFIWQGSSDVDYASMVTYGASMYRYDLTEAKRLLKDAGYANGFKIKLWTYPMSDASYLPDLAAIVQGYWTAIGVKAEIFTTEWAVFLPTLSRVGPSGPPADELVGQAGTMAASPKFIYLSAPPAYFVKGGTLQLTYPGIPELEKLITSATTEIDSKKRAEMVGQIVRRTAETYAYLPIARAPWIAALGSGVDIEFNNPTSAISFYLERAQHRK